MATSFLQRASRHGAWRARRGRARVAAATRRATSPLRLDPTFLILGASRSGTTTLYELLTRHPEVGRPSRKEIQYFDVNYGRGRGWYRSHFPARTSGARAVGEATPLYLLHPLVPARVATDYPEMKLIAVLRDPVDRAYSQWAHEVELGAESLSFEEAVAEEPGRLAGEVERLRVDPGYASWPLLKFSYLARGRYLEQIERWLEHFPREQLLVLRFEDLAERPAELLGEVLGFLGVDPWVPEEVPALNRRSYAPMSPAARARLAAYFDEPNRRLEAFLGRDLGWTKP